MTDSLILPSEILQMILEGSLDADLVTIREAVKRREQMVARYTAVTLKPGDRFYITNISPKYLAGALVEFVEYTGGAAPVRVKMVNTVRRYFSGTHLNLRESHIGTRH